MGKIENYISSFFRYVKDAKVRVNWSSSYKKLTNRFKLASFLHLPQMFIRVFLAYLRVKRRENRCLPQIKQSKPTLVIVGIWSWRWSCNRRRGCRKGRGCACAAARFSSNRFANNDSGRIARRAC